MRARTVAVAVVLGVVIAGLGAGASAAQTPDRIIAWDKSGAIRQVGPLVFTKRTMPLRAAIRAFGRPSKLEPVPGDAEHGNGYGAEDYCFVTFKGRGVRVVSGGGYTQKRICATDKPIDEVIVSSTHYRTERGLKVGASTAEVRRLYPKAEFTGYDSSDRRAALTDDVEVSFDTRGKVSYFDITIFHLNE